MGSKIEIKESKHIALKKRKWILTKKGKKCEACYNQKTQESRQGLNNMEFNWKQNGQYQNKVKKMGV